MAGTSNEACRTSCSGWIYTRLDWTSDGWDEQKGTRTWPGGARWWSASGSCIKLLPREHAGLDRYGLREHREAWGHMAAYGPPLFENQAATPAAAPYAASCPPLALENDISCGNHHVTSTVRPSSSPAPPSASLSPQYPTTSPCPAVQLAVSPAITHRPRPRPLSPPPSKS